MHTGHATPRRLLISAPERLIFELDHNASVTDVYHPAQEVVEHQSRPGSGTRDVRDGVADTRDDHGGARIPDQRDNEHAAGVVTNDKSVGGEGRREVPGDERPRAGRGGHDDGSGDDVGPRRYCEIPYRYAGPYGYPGVRAGIILMIHTYKQTYTYIHTP